jgi:hypothetical protein
MKIFALMRTKLHKCIHNEKVISVSIYFQFSTAQRISIKFGEIRREYKNLVSRLKGKKKKQSAQMEA